MTVAAPASVPEPPARSAPQRSGVPVRPASAWWVLIAGVFGLAAANAPARTLYHVRWSLVVLWLTAVILLILVRFWGYWSTLI
jgi:sterol desaturase/sphingolipid hydroxylase (fatty acid hydroxylase superfamily)